MRKILRGGESFRPEWRTQGIAVQKIATFGRDHNMTLWVNEFGDE
jgi:hypothetical protein